MYFVKEEELGRLEGKGLEEAIAEIEVMVQEEKAFVMNFTTRKSVYLDVYEEARRRGYVSVLLDTEGSHYSYKSIMDRIN